MEYVVTGKDCSLDGIASVCERTVRGFSSIIGMSWKTPSFVFRTQNVPRYVEERKPKDDGVTSIRVENQVVRQVGRAVVAR